MKPKCNHSRNEDHVCLKEQARQCISFKSSRWRRNNSEIGLIFSLRSTVS